MFPLSVTSFTLSIMLPQLWITLTNPLVRVAAELHPCRMACTAFGIQFPMWNLSEWSSRFVPPVASGTKNLVPVGQALYVGTLLSLARVALTWQMVGVIAMA